MDHLEDGGAQALAEEGGGKVVIDATTPHGATEGAACAIHCKLAGKFNLAAHESAFPALRELRVENTGGEALEALDLTLESSPPFAHARTWRIDRVEAGNVARITDHQLRLNGDLLRDITETTQGEVRLRLERDGAVLAESALSIELLATNEWGGAAFMPELLAAFCTPNDPAVDGILRSASEILRQAGRPDLIDGYQSGDRRRVWELASAIYTAIANLGLSYALPPASFEEHGQKVRLPSRVLERKVATCLDTAVLFAAVFEQARLHPVIAMPKEHALVGVWLQPEELADVVIDDAGTLRKRIDLQELLLFETTYTTQSPAPSFSSAIDAAKRQIQRELDDSFIAAIDIFPASQADGRHRHRPSRQWRRGRIGRKASSVGSMEGAAKSLNALLRVSGGLAPSLAGTGSGETLARGRLGVRLGHVRGWKRR